MLRKLFSFLCGASVLFLSACEDKNSVAYMSRDEVYFFYQTTCPHCHDAAKYISETYPGLKIKGLDVKMPGNMRLLEQAAKEYKVGAAVGTPLICMGDKYIMGWGESEQKAFDAEASRYKK